LSLLSDEWQLAGAVLSIVATFAACEFSGVHSFIDRFVVKGNVASWYYWVFQVSICFLFAIIVAFFNRAPALRLMLLGSVVGYVVSFALFNVSLISSNGGLSQMRKTWSQFGPITGLWLSATPPLILLAPLIGVLPFAFYSTSMRICHSIRDPHGVQR